ncbi:hypothetical protein [Streptomyces sp. NPDC096153]|uniref:hypothetical protein n=1 Tax=Streptomyces sp. NPDC096153 TaxID=3155548 RepID=UPI003328A732
MPEPTPAARRILDGIARQLHDDDPAVFHGTEGGKDCPACTPVPQTAAATPMVDVQGRCPACGKTSLFLGAGGYVTCSRLECPEPDAASTLLERVSVPIPANVRAQLAQALKGAVFVSFIADDGYPAMREATGEELADAVLQVRPIAEALAGMPLICSDERHQTKVRALEADLAQLRAGEEPHADERTVATPAQWIWRWNRATPADRLAVAAQVQDACARADHCHLMNHEARLADTTAELAVLRQVARGYCGACGRGDAAPTADQWNEQRQRADRAAAELSETRNALAMQEGISADLRVESKARGDKLAGVSAECDRIEAAVRANPKHPDFDGAYLAAIGHIRRALDPQEQP